MALTKNEKNEQFINLTKELIGKLVSVGFTRQEAITEVKHTLRQMQKDQQVRASDHTQYPDITKREDDNQ